MKKVPLLYSIILFALFSLLVAGCLMPASVYIEPKLTRESYQSEATGKERDYFVYYPANYSERENWPVILFLHGNGERGDGKGELDYVLKHGPLFEAWIQHRDLPFVIIAPQLPMFDQGHITYIADRKIEDIPLREKGPYSYPPNYAGDQPIEPRPSKPSPWPVEGLPQGWPLIENEVLQILETVLKNTNTDPTRVYLTGISYGGFGTWHLASNHPEKFAAIAPVVGYGHTALAASIAEAKLPVWMFSANRDEAVPLNYFYPIANKLERLGHPEVRFTIHADMDHQAWTRVYAGEDLYSWFLEHSLVFREKQMNSEVLE